MKPDELRELQDAIKRLHGCESRHARSVEVNETFQGKPVWQGVVESFDLIGHPKAAKAYAWKHQSGDDDSKARFVAVLAIPPVKTARDAVRASIVAEAKNKTGAGG